MLVGIKDSQPSGWIWTKHGKECVDWVASLFGHHVNDFLPVEKGPQVNLSFLVHLRAFLTEATEASPPASYSSGLKGFLPWSLLIDGRLGCP